MNLRVVVSADDGGHVSFSPVLRVHHRAVHGAVAAGRSDAVSRDVTKHLHRGVQGGAYVHLQERT